MNDAVERERQQPLAERMFDAYLKHGSLENKVEHEIANGMNDAFSWGYFRFDYYDESMEFKGADNAATLTPEQQAALWRLGFKRAWLCHKDGSEIFYYAPPRVAEEKEK